MRVLFSTIGSRGDVQPVVALASHLKALGHEVRVCVPPDFREWVESLRVPVTPIGPEVRRFAASRPTATQPQTPLTAAQRRQMMEATVPIQFETLTSAAQECDVIVAATALQLAGPIGGGEVGDSLRLRRLCAGGAAVAASCTTALAALTWTGSAHHERQQWALVTEVGAEKGFSP